MMVQFAEISKPHHEIASALDAILSDAPAEFEKILKLVLFQELNAYL